LSKWTGPEVRRIYRFYNETPQPERIIMTETQTETPNVEIVVKKSRRLRIDWVVVALGAAAATLFAVNKFNEMNEPTEDAEVTVEA